MCWKISPPPRVAWILCLLLGTFQARTFDHLAGDVAVGAFDRFCGIASNNEQGNNFDATDLASAAAVTGASKVWHYNWLLGTDVSLAGTQFVPMIKTPGWDASAVPDIKNNGGSGTVVKGWNEPDDPYQSGADIHVRERPDIYAFAWTEQMRVAKSLGYSDFVAPAMAHDTCWLDFFLKACEETADCPTFLTYLSFHRYRHDCATYAAESENMGWRDDLSYVLTFYRLMQKYNKRGFNIKGLVWDELGCWSESGPSSEAEQLRYMEQWYKNTLVAVKNGNVSMAEKIRNTPWIMPKGPDAHSERAAYSIGMCSAQDGGPTASEDALLAIQSVVTVAWFSIYAGLNHLFDKSRPGGLSPLGELYFSSCATVKPLAKPFVPTVDPFAGVLVRLVNQESGRKPWAESGWNWEDGFGASLAGRGDSDLGLWKLLRDSGGYRIEHEASGRALYASVGQDWNHGFGAGAPSGAVGADGIWRLQSEGGDVCRIQNVASQRWLYAQVGADGVDGFGAGSSVGDDGLWLVVTVPATSTSTTSVTALSTATTAATTATALNPSTTTTLFSSSTATETATGSRMAVLTTTENRITTTPGHAAVPSWCKGRGSTLLAVAFIFLQFDPVLL